MIDFINTYIPEIMVVLAILTPLLPTIIMRILSDKRLQNTFSNFKVSGALSVDAANKLAQEVTALKQLYDSVIESNINLNNINSSLLSQIANVVEVKEFVEEAITEMRIATEQLRQKDLTIQYLHQELKDIRSKLGVR